MTITALRAVDAIRIVVAETAVLYKEVIASFVRVIGHPNAAFEVFYPTIADDRVGTETVLKTFADLVGTVAIVVALVIDGIDIESLNAQVAT